MTTMRRRSIALVLGSLLVACTGGSHTHDASIDGGDDGAPCSVDDTAIAERAQRTATLEQGRTITLPDDSHAITTSARYLYFIDRNQHLARAAADGSAGVTYSFAFGSTSQLSASDAVLVVQNSDTARTFDARDATQADRVIATASFDTATREVSFAVDAAYVYFVEGRYDGTTRLLRWNPNASSTPDVVTTLESAGATIGSLAGFAVDGDHLVFVESGHLWTMSIAANHATRVPTDETITSTISFDDHGILADTVNAGALYYDIDTQTVRSLPALIEANAYRLSCAFPTDHLYDDEGFALWNGWAVYVGRDGLFAYNFERAEIRPVLLNTRDAPFVTYRQPMVLPNGVLYTIGLTSTSGSLGATGPEYRVDLATRLN